MLTLQMIRIMNKIWVQEGLDMRMVIFRCFSTGRGRGSVASGGASVASGPGSRCSGAGDGTGGPGALLERSCCGQL